jgi:hypothetical protein
MDPIQEAIEYLESHEAGDNFSYRKVAKQFSVDRTTLSRRHKGSQHARTEEARERQLLNPQQEHELVLYIERCTRRGLPPTREMVQNFASVITKCEVSCSWVTRFLHRHADELTIKWSPRIDRERHKADSPSKYKLYFELLHSKMQEHGVNVENTYNMDEKGFHVGVAKRGKRVFSKASLGPKAAVQDGNREWITLLACVCASGESLPPALVYQGTSGIQSGWVDAVEVGKHEIFFSNSESGWSNNDIGLAWLEQVFERFTKQKARRSYRLLILDGHGSHLTTDFIDFCDSNRILLAIFPPHSTHSLQPLDVVLFGPLSKYYTQNLDRHLHRSQGITRITKRDFFENFWPAWSSTMRLDLIKKSFQATGVWPMDADAVLKRFNNRTSRQAEAPQLGQHSDGNSWRELRKVFNAVVPDKSKVEARQLEASLHSLQVQNELLHYENQGLQQALNARQKRTSNSKTMDLQQREEYHGGAILWSPRKLREARYRARVKEDEAEQLQLQKARNREATEASKLLQKQQAAEAKAARQRAAEERRAAKKAQAETLAAQRALKKQQRDAATAQKCRDTLNKGKRKASHKAAKHPTKRRRVAAARSGADAVPPAASPPPEITSSGRNVRKPARFK